MKWIIGLLSLFPSLVFADNEFYVYANFDGVVSGFTRIATIFGDSNYSFFIYVAVFLGIMAGVLIKTGMGFLGKAKGSDALSAFGIPLFGVALFKALVFPTTTVHIYDPVQNKYQSVGDIPSIVAFTAEITNALERFATDTISSSNTARERHANGITIQLALNLLFEDPLLNKPYTKKNLNSYMSSCLPVALASQKYNFEMKTLESGTNNLLAYLEKAKSNTVNMPYYDEDNKSGYFVSCSTGYTGIKQDLTNASTFTDYIKTTCNKTNFSTDSTEELEICKSRLEELTNNIIGDPSNPVTTEHLAASEAIAQSLFKKYSDKKGSAIQAAGHTRQISEGLGSLIVTEGYLPVMRYNVMLLVIGLVPFFCLMFVTPMLFKSLHLMITLFIFIGVWGLADAMLHDIIFDQVRDALSALRHNSLGAVTLLTAPNELQQALASFGKQQSMGIVLALALSTIFFKFSGSAFARMGEKLTTDIDRIGNDAGQGGLDPSSNMHNIERYGQAANKHDLYTNIGSQRTYDAIGYNSTQQTRSSDAYLEQMKPSYSLDQINNMPAQISGGEKAGRVEAHSTRANLDGSELGTYSRSNSFVEQSVKNADTEITSRNASLGNENMFVNNNNDRFSESLYENQAISRSGSTSKLKVFSDEGDAVRHDTTRLTSDKSETIAMANKAQELNPDSTYSEAVTNMAARNKENELTEVESRNRLNEKVLESAGFDTLQEATDAKNGDVALNLTDKQSEVFTSKNPEMKNRGAGSYRTSFSNDGEIVTGTTANGFSANTNNSDVIDNRKELNNSYTENSSRTIDSSDSETDQIIRSTGVYTQGNVYRSEEDDEAIELLSYAAEQGTMEQSISSMVQELSMSDSLSEQQLVSDTLSGGVGGSLNGRLDIIGSSGGSSKGGSGKGGSGKPKESKSHLGESATKPTSKSLGEHMGQKSTKAKSPDFSFKSLRPQKLLGDLAGLNANVALSGDIRRSGDDKEISQRDMSIDSRQQQLLETYEQVKSEYPEEYQVQAEQVYSKYQELIQADIEQSLEEVDYDFNPLKESVDMLNTTLDDLGVSGTKFKL